MRSGCTAGRLNATRLTVTIKFRAAARGPPNHVQMTQREHGRSCSNAGRSWPRGVGTAVAVLAAAVAAAAMPAAAGSVGDTFRGRAGEIAFLRQGDIYAVDGDGRGLRLLVASPGLETGPAWSPGGRRFAFASDRDGDDSEIYVAAADGSRQVALTDNFRVDDHSPAWSPDGMRIAFVRDANDAGGEDIWVMRADGTQPERLTARRGFDNEPAWSPDGKLIAFDRGGEVFLMRPDGTGVRRLTRGGGAAASWSPDGKLLAVVRRGEIYAVRRDGGHLRRLTRNHALDWAPAWSPDDRRLVFESDRASRATRAGRPTHLYLMRTDGSRQRRLTGARGPDSAPDWQPLPRSPEAGVRH